MNTIERVHRIRTKVERAKKHISDLDVRIRFFSESKPYTIAAKPHPIPQIEHTTLYVSDVKPIPFEINLVIGDAIHNLRSALDHLAWQLVESGGGTPTKNTYFPICQSAQQYAAAISNGEIQKMRSGAESALCAIQPYASGDDTLFSLHELDIIDKHRLLIATISAIDKWGVDVSRNRTTIWFDQQRFEPLVVGHEIVNIPTSTYNRQQHQDFKLGIDIAFGEPKVAEGYLAIQFLEKLADFVDGIITAFESFL